MNISRNELIHKAYHNVVTTNSNGQAFDINGNFVEIDENTLSEKLTELQADYDALQYQRDRASAYPSIQDQLDKIYHSGLTAWKADIKAVKDKFPKP